MSLWDRQLGAEWKQQMQLFSCRKLQGAAPTCNDQVVRGDQECRLHLLLQSRYWKVYILKSTPVRVKLDFDGSRYDADNFPVWIVSDCRRETDLRYFSEQFGDKVKRVRIVADDKVRAERWQMESLCFLQKSIYTFQRLGVYPPSGWSREWMWSRQVFFQFHQCENSCISESMTGT